MKNLIIFFMATLSFVSCSSQSSVRFGINAKYFLDTNETNMPIDDNLISFYQKYFDTDTIHQLPLNRYIRAKNYNIFIALAVYDNINTLKKFFLTSETNYLDSVMAKKTVIFRFFQKKKTYFVYRVFLQNKKTHYPAVLTFYSTDSLYIQKIYNNKQWILTKLGYNK